MTTVSDGSTPTGSDLPLEDTAPIPFAAADLPELPAPPPLLSHLQPEHLAELEAGTAASGAGTDPADGEAAAVPGGRSLRDEPAERRRGATPSGSGRVILPIALCLVGVVALGAGWTHLESDRAEAAQARLAVASGAKPPVPTFGAGSPGPEASNGAGASPTPVVSSSPKASPSASVSPSPSASKPAFVVDRSVPVVVLNATARTGLAGQVAAGLRAKGWTVVSVGNWRSGGIPLTTVFVTGRTAAAATMRRDVKPADGTLPTRDGMPRNRLVLVIGNDYPRR